MTTIVFSDGRQLKIPADPKPVYEATVTRNPLGFGFTVYRDGQIIGRADGLLTLFYRSRADALNAATRFAQHDQERHRVRLPV